ncbi:NADP-dependent oxidoreductase [Streptomyces sp. TS71-3]|uniref:NADP-dependent oxidoreductase n=1 Tax=Streptomyces sp. TS71-3 TaxID=2733862 RepID=UPI001B147812|nr:NADP-dependent oxidoreductase [Streptomyces sp. TS71-3]GHJ39335.1 zinc-binding alcohol dehydrogenase [Streptomyces sp. TS71-3]
MRAIGFTEFGGPEVLHEVELPTPEPGAGEVRIRVRAAAVSPTDTVRRSGARAQEVREVPGPYVVGMDVAGVVERIGTGTATDLAVGEHVMGVVVPRGTHGGYAEQVVLPVDSVVRVPSGADDVSASTLPMNGLTARLTLDLLGLREGQTIAVTGAAGVYGGYVVQMAGAEGLRVMADAAPHDRDLVRELGADIVVDRGDDVAERIRRAVPEGVDGLADGAVLDDKVIGAVRDGGGIATVRFYTGTSERGITYHPVRVRDYATERAKLDGLRDLAERGGLTMRVAGTYPAAQAAEAHRRLAAGGTRGRLVLTFGD